jgi:ATP-dependent DNA ligase
MTLEQIDIKPPCFPARPVSGAPLDKAPPKHGEWAFETKVNGWRTLVHIPTGTMFNRHDERLTIAGEFKEALDAMRTTLDAEAFKWADCEALDRRHEIGRGCLIVLDVIPEGIYVNTPWRARRKWLEAALPELDLSPPKDFPKLSLVTTVDGSMDVWRDLQRINKRLGCEFYEGLVAKRADSIYPIQRRSASQEFPFWTKHRWDF